jgi:hypothetical protein
MEVFTLIQTGKTAPKPLVLIDDEEGYWENWFRFIRDHLLGRGLISAGDFSLFTISRDEEEGVNAIVNFYRNYHSIRFVESRLIIRLHKELSDQQIHELEDEFPEILMPGGRISRTSPLPEETDEPDLLHLPRLLLDFNHQQYGLLMAFIRKLNTF